MGLDCYLYKVTDLMESEKREREASVEVDALWDVKEKYEDFTQEEKDFIYAKSEEIYAKYNLDKYGTDVTLKTKIEIDSSKYPDHYFKIGYMRSSYNGGGINRLFSNIGLPILEEIFEAPHNSSEWFKPNWEKIKVKVEEIIPKLKEQSVACERIDVLEYSASSCEEALKVYKQELEDNPKCNYNYRGKHGTFFMHEPLKVNALIGGKEKYIGKEQPCIYMVYNMDYSWYVQALEIIIEMCDYVMQQEDKDIYYMYFSG